MANFFHFINNEKIFELPISILYRILSKTQIEKSNEENFHNFLFKCLEKFGKNGSILFRTIELNQMNHEEILKLKEFEKNHLLKNCLINFYDDYDVNDVDLN